MFSARFMKNSIVIWNTKPIEQEIYVIQNLQSHIGELTFFIDVYKTCHI
jgi:hypothetical protein